MGGPLAAGSGGLTATPARGFGLLLAGPAVVLLLALMVVPLLGVLATGFADGDGGWSLDQYRQLASRTFFLSAFLRTLALGGGVAAVTLLLATPLAFWMLRHPAWRAPLLLALTGPLLVNVVARLYGWQLLLADSGPVNRLLPGGPVLFVGSLLGTGIVMVHVMLPYATLPVFAAMRAVDPAALDAARTLGARPWRVFAGVVLPQSLPGLATGFILVFTLSAASFVVPAVMGGGRINTFPTLVYQEMMALNVPRAAALATVLLVLLVPLAGLARLFGRATP